MDIFSLLLPKYTIDKNKKVRLITLFSGYDSQKLGFNYIVGNNEIDLSKGEIAKMYFTLKKEACLERYFTYSQKEYNGSLTAFDKEFELPCTYNISDEMFSYLNKLITVKLDDVSTYREYSPLIISKEFATSENISLDIEEDIPEVELPDDVLPEEGEGEEGEGSTPPSEGVTPPVDEETPPAEEDEEVYHISIAEQFSNNIVELLKLMNISASQTFKGSDGKTIIDLNVDDISLVKYAVIQFADANYIYTVEFDVTDMVNDVERVNSDYIVFIDFHKDAK